MNEATTCTTLEQVRDQIDRIDALMLNLLAERGGYVRATARLKQHAAQVPAPARVEQVITQVTGRARELGADPVVVEATWRAMMGAFIAAELAEHAALHPPSP